MKKIIITLLSALFALSAVAGTTPATTARDATNVTFNSFTANWEASNLEGATYSINVWNEDYDLIASASGLEETSYAVSNLDPESYYSYRCICFCR